MANYKLSNESKNELIRVYQYGVKKFGELKADRYFETFFEYFDTIAEIPFSFEAVDYIKTGYRRCPCGIGNIYYRLNDENIVEIMSIIGRQDVRNKLK